MPLISMSPNIQELDSPSRKRDHNEYSDNANEQPTCVSTKGPQLSLIDSPSIDPSVPAPSNLASTQSTPAQSSPAALTETGSSTPARYPTSPNTPSRLPCSSATTPTRNTSNKTQPAIMPLAVSALTQPAGSTPAKKRKKVTDQERKAQADEKAAREAEKERVRKEKEVKIQEKKAEADRKKVEAEKKKFEAEKKKVEAEKKKAEAAEKKAELERKKKAEAAEKKAELERKQRAQLRIGSFFTKQSSTPKKTQSQPDMAGAARSPSPVPQEKNEYQRLTQEFFIKENVTLAKNEFALTPEAQAVKVAILDDFVAGRRPPVAANPFDPVSSFFLPTAHARRRGKLYASVRELLSGHSGPQPILSDVTTKSRIQRTQNPLKRIPLKHLQFHEDVRPAFYGTVTSVVSLASLRKLARNPIAKDMPLNYDYDSEAEWCDDGEGDDVSLMDEEDVDEEDGEAMDDFLDDSEDISRGPRMIAGTLEPESSGICFEDRTRRNPNPQMYKFRMEFMIPTLKHQHSIDPFSTEYWDQELKASVPKVEAGKSTVQNNDDKVADGAMAPPPVPSVISALCATSAAAVSNLPEPQDLVPASQLETFKATVLEFSFMPKAAMIATLKKKLHRCTSTQIKTTLDYVAEKPNKKGDWQIKSGL